MSADLEMRGIGARSALPRQPLPDRYRAHRGARRRPVLPLTPVEHVHEIAAAVGAGPVVINAGLDSEV
jgi:hypothetical protein